MEPRREIHVPVYWVMVGLLVMLISPVLSMVAAVQIAERNSIRMATEQRGRSCSLYAALLDAYDEAPPATATGKNVRKAYLQQYQSRGCSPARK
jgi:hypothetical protein